MTYEFRLPQEDIRKHIKERTDSNSKTFGIVFVAILLVMMIVPLINGTATMPTMFMLFGLWLFATVISLLAFRYGLRRTLDLRDIVPEKILISPGVIEIDGECFLSQDIRYILLSDKNAGFLTGYYRQMMLVCTYGRFFFCLGAPNSVFERHVNAFPEYNDMISALEEYFSDRVERRIYA